MMPINKFVWRNINNIYLTVLFPRFLILQVRYAVLPKSAVTFLDAAISKYGPFLLICGEPWAEVLVGLGKALSTAPEDFTSPCPRSSVCFPGDLWADNTETSTKKFNNIQVCFTLKIKKHVWILTINLVLIQPIYNVFVLKFYLKCWYIFNIKYIL